MKKTSLTSYGIALTRLVLAGANQAQADDMHVPADYPTIQAAIDAAADGDTVQIAPGVYVEQTSIIGKNLTLIGQPGTILRAFPGLKAGGSGVSQRRPLLFIFQAANVVLRNLTFEGDQLGEQQEDIFLGTYFLDSGGAVEDCRFVGFRDKSAGQNQCEAIWVLNNLPGAPFLEMRIVRNTVADCYGGIRILGSRDHTSPMIKMAHNTISGVGPNATKSNLEGIEVLEGAISR